MEYLAAMRQQLLAATLGLLSHWLYFIHGEHHMRAPLYGCLFLASFPALYFLELQVYHDSGLAIKAGMQILGFFLLGLYTSMTAYRVFFHRLSAFPGPFGARVSKIWHVWQVRNAQNHLLMDRLHRQYGTFVRTGKLHLLCMTRYS